jgi:hypothetical protein
MTSSTDASQRPAGLFDKQPCLTIAPLAQRMDYSISFRTPLSIPLRILQQFYAQRPLTPAEGKAFWRRPEKRWKRF